MANSRMILRCKHCGEVFHIAKGYYGSYVLYDFEGTFVERYNKFLTEHEMGFCSGDWCSSDDARDHFEIGEFYE